MNQDFSNLNNSDANQSDNEDLNNQDLSNNQTISQQFNATQYQNTTGQNINFENSYQQPSNLAINNQNENNNSKRKSKVGFVIIIIAILLAIVIGVIILTNKGDTKNETNESNNETNINTNTNKSSDGKYVIYLNNMKITLGETTMDYIVKNTDLKVIKDETSHGTCGSSSCDVKEGDTREIVLSDGVNSITITSYFGYPNKTKKLATSHHTDDPAFDVSTGTKLIFVDNAIGKNVNVGDSFTEDEYYDIYKNTGTCFSSSGMIQCSQTKLYANDYFVYWLDSNYKIINMSADLKNY